MRIIFPLLMAAALLGLAEPALARTAADATIGRAAAASHKAKIAAYARARAAYEAEAEAYWQSIADKRRARFAKRRDGTPVLLEDYVLTQPPVYTGPPRPPGYVAPRRDPSRPIARIPVLADFLKAAAEQFQFVPDRPKDDAAFKQAYAKAATAAGLTREQAVRIYAFETGGNGTYDGQAGLVGAGGPRKGGRAISPAMGYNQLLSTNSLSLIAEHGDKFVAALQQSAGALGGAERAAMERKIASLRKMIEFSRTVPRRWADQDKLAKFTRGGTGIHARCSTATSARCCKRRSCSIPSCSHA